MGDDAPDLEPNEVTTLQRFPFDPGSGNGGIETQFPVGRFALGKDAFPDFGQAVELLLDDLNPFFGQRRAVECLLPDQFPVAGQASRIQFPADGEPPHVGWRLVQKDLGATLRLFGSGGEREVALAREEPRQLARREAVRHGHHPAARADRPEVGGHALRGHRHVEGDGVARREPPLVQAAGEAIHQVLELASGEGLDRAALFAPEEHRDLLEIAGEAASRDVELRPGKPTGHT